VYTASISLIYEVQHSHILQVEVSDLASVFPLFMFDEDLNEAFKETVTILFTKYSQYHRLEFTGQHYTTVAQYFMGYFLEPP